MSKSLFMKEMDVPEMIVLVIFILYLIFPVATPGDISPYIESPLGVVVLLLIVLALFIYSHPIVAILFLFVAYTLLRRSSIAQPKVAYVQHTQETRKKMKDAQKELEMATPPHHQVKKADMRSEQPKSLEEEIVEEKSPVGVSGKITIVETTFLPVSTNVTGTSQV